MGLRIATNVQSIAAQRQLGIASLKQQEALSHLSSGSRITKAGDDAAGLALSEKMNANLRSIRQDIRNANDGVSLIQTAEGGMSEIGNILTRFRELAIQASTDTIGDTEREIMDKEMQTMKAEISRLAAATEFNGRKLLNGEGGIFEFQVGLHNKPTEDRFTFDTAKSNVTLESLGIEGISAQDKESARNGLADIDLAIKNVVGNRAELGALQNRFQTAINSLGSYDENLSEAKSRIRDADVAFEASELMKNNILAQASLSVLSQANQNGQMALKLIG